MNAAVPPELRPPAPRTPAPTSPAPAHTGPWSLSVVVPACNAADTLPMTLAALSHLPGGPAHEIVVVENGSQDGTWALLQQLSADWQARHAPTRLVVLRSGKGIGDAYRAGVAATTGDRVLLTADDLPFGTSDLEAVLACRTLPRFAIGSKAHPRSRVRRTLPRRVASQGFRLARAAMLGLTVGDTQGTFVIEGDLARRLVSATTIPGFGMTTELVAIARRDGVHAVELPVVLQESHHHAASRINWVTDTTAMLTDLARMRRRLGPVRRRSPVVLPRDASA